MRGQQVLFEEIFVAPELTVNRTGRSEELHELRNSHLTDRYYYYGKFTDKRYEAIMNELRTEFHIEISTIQKLLDENYDKLTKLKADQPNKAYFKERWPFMVW